MRNPWNIGRNCLGGGIQYLVSIEPTTGTLLRKARDALFASSQAQMAAYCELPLTTFQQAQIVTPYSCHGGRTRASSDGTYTGAASWRHLSRITCSRHPEWKSIYDTACTQTPHMEDLAYIARRGHACAALFNCPNGRFASRTTRCPLRSGKAECLIWLNGVAKSSSPSVWKGDTYQWRAPLSRRRRPNAHRTITTTSSTKKTRMMYAMTPLSSSGSYTPFNRTEVPPHLRPTCSVTATSGTTWAPQAIPPGTPM